MDFFPFHIFNNLSINRIEKYSFVSLFTGKWGELSDDSEEEEREWKHADELQTVEQRVCEDPPLKIRQESFILRYESPLTIYT